jgi:hypothetical protein
MSESILHAFEGDPAHEEYDEDKVREGRGYVNHLKCK